MKKVLLIMFSVVFICINVMGSVPSQAATKTEYSVKVGKKLTIKTSLKNAVWGSDDTSIATVSKKGVVKGIAAGKCTVVATSEGKSELFSITVSKKKSSTIVVYTDKSVHDNMYGYHIALKDNPTVYIGGKAFIYYTSTFYDLYNIITNNTCKGLPEINEIITDDFKVDIYKNEEIIASLVFRPTNTMIAKDALLVNAEFGFNAPSDFYYFNKNFKLSSFPEFENFKDTKLFSETIPWVYGDHNDYELDYSSISYETIEKLPKKYVYCFRELYCEEDYYPHTIYFFFDSTTHKCIYATMTYGFWD